jgi:hypothetical protein
MTTIAPPLPTLPGFVTCYGVPVCSMGEDGELLALGHHDRRRVIAALNRYARRELGWDDLLDGSSLTSIPDGQIEAVWCQRSDACPYHQMPEPICGDCADVRGGKTWCVTYEADETPGAFPAMRWIG